MTKTKASRFLINRELSWLDFNERVLYEAEEKNNPLLERLKFLSIVTSNLEEFFMIRVAVIKKQRDANLFDGSSDSLSPSGQLAVIRERVILMLSRQYKLFFKGIIPEFTRNDIQILTDYKEMQAFSEHLESVFQNDLMPLLTPLSVGPAHPFPTLVTGRFLSCSRA